MREHTTLHLGLLWVATSLAFASVAAADGYAGYVQAQDAAIADCRIGLQTETIPTEGSALFGYTGRLGCELEAQLRGLPTGGQDFLEPAEVEAVLREVSAILASDVEQGNTALWGQARFRTVFLLHRYGSVVGGWSTQTEDAVRDMLTDAHHPWLGGYAGGLSNWELPRAGAWTLGGEALGDADMLQEGIDLLYLMAGRVARQGTNEPNSPHYAAHLWNNLVLMQGVQDPEAKELVDALLDYVALTAAHLYLPGGGLGAPQARGTRGQSTFVVDPPPDGKHAISYIDLLVGDPELDANPAQMAALTDYAMPALVRSIFLDKGAGYEFRGRHHGYVGDGDLSYDVGWQGLPTIPWQAVMVPDGTAQMGIMYGAGETGGQDVSMGAYLRTPATEPSFSVFAHVHPRPLGWSDEDPDPQDPNIGPPRMHERSTFRRFMHGRALIQLWDTTLEPATPQLTQMHVPHYGDAAQGTGYLEVASGLANPWRIGQSGDSYVAILPLGQITSETATFPNTGTLPYQNVELEARSGSIVELATTAEFPTIEDYGADLQGRALQFSNTATSFSAQFETASGESMALDYYGDQRVLDGEVQADTALESGLMDSPFVSWNEKTFVLKIHRPGFPVIEHDFGDPSLPTAPHSVRIGNRSLVSDKVGLSWSESLDDRSIDHYQIWMRTDAGETLVVDDIDASPASFHPVGVIEEDITADFFVRAVDDEGNLSRRSNVIHDVLLGPLDTEPPSTPQNLTASALGPGVILDWEESDDDRGVVSYRVYRSDSFETDAPPPHFVDTEGLQPGTTYSYYLRAQDAAGNLSAPSNTVQVETSPEFNPPPSMTLYGSSAPGVISLIWLLHGLDDTGTGSYLVFRDGAFFTFVSPQAEYWSDYSVVAGIPYSYYIVVWDVYGNASEPSNTVTITAE